MPRRPNDNKAAERRAARASPTPTRPPSTSAARPTSSPCPPIAIPSRSAPSGPSPPTSPRWPRWLKACRIDTVVLESTGHFWIPVYDALEAAGFEVVLVDPRTLTRHLRKKSDVIDCQWLQDLHAVGLLKGCFRPDDQVRALRALWRHRARLVTEAGRSCSGCRRCSSR